MRRTILAYMVCLLGCDTTTTTATCGAVTGIEGDWRCAGACVTTSQGKQSLVEVSGEVDTISPFLGPDRREHGLFQIQITGGGGFTELEIGALAGSVLRTATAKVSDGKHPVLEEYIFSHDDQCQATSYTKVVRNPTADDFKACRLSCAR